MFYLARTSPILFPLAAILQNLVNRLFLILTLFLVSCQTEYKYYYNLHKLNPKTFENKLSKKPKNLIHIYSFDNNIMNRKINGFQSLTFNTLTNEKVYIDTEEKNRKKYIASKTAPKYFKEFDFILENYLNGNIEYLKSLENSFSGAEIGSYFYVFDFRTYKVLKVNAIAFNSNGKLIQ